MCDWTTISLTNGWSVQSAFWTRVHSQDLQIVFKMRITDWLHNNTSTHTFQHEEQLRDTGTAVTHISAMGSTITHRFPWTSNNLSANSFNMSEIWWNTSSVVFLLHRGVCLLHGGSALHNSWCHITYLSWEPDYIYCFMDKTWFLYHYTVKCKISQQFLTIKVNLSCEMNSGHFLCLKIK